eukprot:TRINITY_DN9604_c0_g1_i2.p1 TRINITY_DN9604_c0_g1~~TRINITY_DN9604_c0_g1_i2.p1  ORF type:complete len:388 (+),score=59.04 TRINITY_DN9604_c0_g1_i2:30-1193(+)
MALVESQSNPDVPVTINVFKCIVGAGMAGVPYALCCCGLIPGLVMLVACCIASTYTMILLAWITQQHLSKMSSFAAAKEVSYVVLGTTAYGQTGKVSVWTTLLIAQGVAAAGYLVFVTRILRDVLSVSALTTNLFVWGLGVALCLPRSPAYLAPVSLLGNISMIVAVSAVVACGSIYSPPTLANIELFAGGMKDWGIAFGILCLSFSSHPEVMGIASVLEPAVVPRFPSIITRSMMTAGALYVSLGVFSVACFGAKTDQVVYNNLPAQSAYVAVIKLAMSVTVLANFPLTLFPVAFDLELYLQRSGVFSGSKTDQMMLRLGIGLLPGLVAVVFRDSFDLIGAVAGGFAGITAFLMPPLLFLRLNPDCTAAQRIAAWIVPLVFTSGCH